MNELLQAFTLGNAAILTNACLLPLYPGLIAFLAGNAGKTKEKGAGSTALLGVLVLAGVLTTMTAIGFILFLLNASFGDVLGILLPVIYVLVIALGIAMLRGLNPFARLQMSQAPMLQNTHVTAYVYGLFFGPMTLPCTGPIILSAFALGANDAAALVDGLLYFFFFGLGFGWPLLVLPLIALPIQRRIVSWLSNHHDVLTHASGALLVAVGIFGIITELWPQIDPSFEFGQSAQLLYWVAAAFLTLGIGWWSYRRLHADAPAQG